VYNFNRALKISQSLKAKTTHLFVLLFTKEINLATFMFTQRYPQVSISGMLRCAVG